MLISQGQSGLEAKILASASISLSYYVIGNFSGKNRVKIGNFVNFSTNNLKSYVVNHYLVLFLDYFWPWPQPPEIGLVLEAAVVTKPHLITESRTVCIFQHKKQTL